MEETLKIYRTSLVLVTVLCCVLGWMLMYHAMGWRDEARATTYYFNRLNTCDQMLDLARSREAQNNVNQ